MKREILCASPFARSREPDSRTPDRIAEPIVPIGVSVSFLARLFICYADHIQ